MRIVPIFSALGVWLALSPAAAADPPQPSTDPLLTALQAELQRTMGVTAGSPDAPYFISYRVTEAAYASLRTRHGAVVERGQNHGRHLDISVRVGSHQLDSTHRLRDDRDFFSALEESIPLSLDGDSAALQSQIWSGTMRALYDAQERFVRVTTNQKVKVAERDRSGDFSVEPPVQRVLPLATLTLDLTAWEATLKALSARIESDPNVEVGEVELHSSLRTITFVNSEGAHLRQTLPWVRISLQAQTSAEDGMDLSLYRWMDVADPTRLPTAAELQGWADAVRTDLLALRAAPLGEPYSGPVLLDGPAAGVFIHEVLGHRVEGHRQKNEKEGQTFREAIGRTILPTYIDIVDDPTLPHYAGQDLNGHYAFDEEGVPAARVVLVDDGVFRGFLMGRSPIEGFPNSNGHGRAEAGSSPVSRMASTILETRQPLPEAEMRRRLIEEARKLGLPYGMRVEDLSGGFTLTGRVFPNSFNVRAERVWRVYVDGRPDELVRGLDLVGTPLDALSKVIATGDKPGAFNGWCGAESGSIPNSVVSPSLLVRQMEVQRKEKGQNRPPLLPRPAPGGRS